MTRNNKINLHEYYYKCLKTKLAMKILIEIICFSRLVNCWVLWQRTRYIVILADKLFAPVQEHFDQKKQKVWIIQSFCSGTLYGTSNNNNIYLYHKKKNKR